MTVDTRVGKWITDRCREKGMALVASGGLIFAVPNIIQKQPGLKKLIHRYHRDILEHLDGLVE